MRWMYSHPWKDLTGIEIHGTDEIRRRATIPRAAALGLFAIAFKKVEKRSFLELRGTVEGIYRIDDRSPTELRAYLHPVLMWWERYGRIMRTWAEVSI